MLDSGWVLFGAIVASFGGVYPAEVARRRKMWRARDAVLAVMLLASAYVSIRGVRLADGWTNPLAGQGWQKIAEAVHTPRGWLVVGVIIVWPYFLMAAGAFFGFGSVVLLRRRPPKPILKILN